MKNILVIDDDFNIRNLLKESLRDKQFLVSEANNGQKGVEMCRKRNYDLIIVDIFMPEMGGIEFIKELQRFSPKTKIIAMSGGEKHHFFTSNTVLNTAIARGALRAFKKPFQIKDILHQIDELLALDEVKINQAGSQTGATD